MAIYREVRTGDDSVPAPAVENDAPTTDRQEYHMNVAARVIYLVGGLLLVLLALRFLLALLGANPANGFANFIYTVSHPFASPFFSLFSYDQILGKSKFEAGTLVAIVVYAIVMEVLARLATIGSRRPQP